MPATGLVYVVTQTEIGWQTLAISHLLTEQSDIVRNKLTIFAPFLPHKIDTMLARFRNGSGHFRLR